MLRLTGFFVALITLLGFATNIEAQIIYSAPQMITAKQFDVKSYDASIWLDRKLDSISGWVEMKAVTLGQLSEIIQHAKFLTVDSVFVDGILAVAGIPDSNGMYKITGFPNTYQNASPFTVKTYYHGKGKNEGASAWGGVQNTGGMMFAMGVGFSAPYVSCTRHWMPCYDEPEDKADSVTLKFFADTLGTAAGIPDIVVSNGIQTGFLTGTDNGKTNYFEWKVSHPISTYLLTFALGGFKKISIANPLGIPFDIYSFARDTAKARAKMETRVAPALVYFDSLFAHYPFEKVGYVVAPIGSMEHQTMVTLASGALAAADTTTAVHELSHMWWGDRVTCFDFKDPWLNEGFAKYCESLFQERFFGSSHYWAWQHASISASLRAADDSLPLYGAPDLIKPRNNYPPIIYEKGAAVLGMLRYFLGDTAFFTAVKTYGDHFAYANASSIDLQEAFEVTTGKDLQWFFTKWVHSAGHPEMNVRWSNKDMNIHVQFDQTQDSTKVGFFQLPIMIEARTAAGKIERHEVQMDSIKVSDAYFTNSFIPDSIVVDPDGALIKKINSIAKLSVWQAPKPPAPPRELQFAPNPSDQKNMIVSFVWNRLNTDQRAVIELYDSNGRKVFENTLGMADIDANENRIQYNFNTGSIPSGTYFASLLLNNKIVAQGKLVITE